jgi:hypothetical protein
MRFPRWQRLRTQDCSQIDLSLEFRRTPETPVRSSRHFRPFLANPETGARELFVHGSGGSIQPSKGRSPEARKHPLPSMNTSQHLRKIPTGVSLAILALGFLPSRSDVANASHSLQRLNRLYGLELRDWGLCQHGDG